MRHIVTEFDNELRALKDGLIEMGEFAHAQFKAAMGAFGSGDVEDAVAVIDGDARLDAHERMIDGLAVRVLTLRQPMAGDMRRVVTSLKISADLERIGDYAKNIAKRTIALSAIEAQPAKERLIELGHVVEQVLAAVVEAYAARDADRAVAAWRRDKEVDILHDRIVSELTSLMERDPRYGAAAVHLLFVAKSMERVGDHATNVAEHVHFLALGKVLEADRPRGESSDSTSGY